MNSRNSGEEGGQSKEKQSDGNFPPNDPSGDKTVSEMLKKAATRNHKSGENPKAMWYYFSVMELVWILGIGAVIVV